MIYKKNKAGTGDRFAPVPELPPETVLEASPADEEPREDPIEIEDKETSVEAEPFPTEEIALEPEAEEVVVKPEVIEAIIREPEPQPTGDHCADLILHEMPRRAVKFGERLHPCLTGTVKLVLPDRNESYVVDWRGENLSASLGENEQAECEIVLDSRDLLAIAAGDLNPQIAMLSHKVGVSGKMDLAMYVFNLIMR